MINAHSHIKWPDMEFWIINEWKRCCFGEKLYFEFTLFSFEKSIIFNIENNYEHDCFILTLLNFSFVLRIRRN